MRQPRYFLTSAPVAYDCATTVSVRLAEPIDGCDRWVCCRFWNAAEQAARYRISGYEVTEFFVA